MAEPAHGYVHVTIDGIAVPVPCNVHALVFTPRSAQHEVVVYDGLDTSSGDYLQKLVADVKETITINFDGGLYCRNGVYAAFSNSPGNLLIVYDTVETLP